MTIQHRQEHGVRIVQAPDEPVPTMSGSKLWDHHLTLCGLSLSCDGLILLPKQDCPIRDTRIVYQEIRRDMRNTAGGGKISTLERWCYLATPDKDDQAAAAAAKVPALSQFFDEDSKVQTAPIINLAKLNIWGRNVDMIAFNLHPHGGQTIDFRAMTYPFEYYVRSGANINTMLLRTVTPGCWDYF